MKQKNPENDYQTTEKGDRVTKAIRPLLQRTLNFHINSDDLHRKFQFIYDSVKLRLTAVIPHGNISNDEASHIAADILYLTDVLHSSCTS